jgi:chromate transporter
MRAAAAAARPGGSAGEVLVAFLRLGCTAFGGPVAHLGYFREELVARRRWIDEAGFADLVALCQFLPGPASSQVGMAMGLLRAGWWGGLAAWIGFTLPSAILMIAAGYGIAAFATFAGAGWLHGLGVVAVAVVARAVWGMATSLAPDRERASLAIAAAILVLAVPGAAGQIAAIVAGGVIGRLFLGGAPIDVRDTLRVAHGRRVAAALLLAFAALLILLPILHQLTPSHAVAMVNAFYRAGSLVFGGGHVVLPLLPAAVVPSGWIDQSTFLAGYGAAQALPGPLFTFAAFLGTASRASPSGWAGGVLALVSIFLPSFLLIGGALPFWDRLRRMAAVQAALRGVNAAVVGLLLAALYTPVWTSAIRSPGDFGLGLAAFLLLAIWRLPPWLVVILGAAGGALLQKMA